MNDPFTIVDTLSLPDDAPVSGPDTGAPPVLARLPRLLDAAPKPASPATITRVDPAEAIHHPAYLDEAPPAAALDGGLAEAGLAAVFTRAAPADPSATIRIDTVRPTEIDGETQPEPAPNLAPAAAVVAPSQAGPESLEDPFTTWLIDVESAVLPYSRWIALAAIAAALGLTVVLLRGAEATGEDGAAGPRVEIDAALSDSIVLDSDTIPSDPSGLPPVWPSAEPLADTSDAPLRPIDEGTAPSVPAPKPPTLVAAGPASAAPRPPHAELTGQVHAAAPDTGYTRTATVPRTNEGATR